MDKWQETIMTREQLVVKAMLGHAPCNPNIDMDKALVAQAEISFKAGEQKGIDIGYSAGKIDGQATNHERHGKECRQAEQQGRQEVVEWVEKNSKEHSHDLDHIQVSIIQWQAFLKEKGLK